MWLIVVLFFLFCQVANRRLFSVVREERQLTYDASFSLQQRDIVEGTKPIGISFLL